MRLDQLRVPCRIAWHGRQIDVQQLGIACDVGQLAIAGQTTLPDKVTARSLGDWLHESFTVQGELDLARLARLLPQTLHVRQGIAITSGNVRLALASSADGSLHRWSGQLQATNITATNAGRAITWNQPIDIDLAAHDSATGPVVEKLDCQASFVHLAASGTLEKFTAQASCDLNRLATELGQFVNLGDVRPAGDGQATLAWQRAADGRFSTNASCRVNNFQLAMAGHKWSEPSLAVALDAAGQIPTAAAARIDKATLDVTAGPGADRLTVNLLEPATDVASITAPGNWHFALALQGDLARWQARLAPWIPLEAWQLGGAADMSVQVAYSAKGLNCQQVHAAVNRLHAWGNGWFIDEPALQIDTAASWDATTRTLQFAPTTLASSAVAIQAKQTSLRLPANRAPNLAGAVAWQADLARLGAWMHDPRTAAPLAASGRFTGQANLSDTGTTTTAQLSGAIDNLAVFAAPAAAPQPLAPAALVPAALPRAAATNAPFWQEKQLTIAAAGKYDRATDLLSFDSFDIASIALHFKGAGKVAQLTTQRNADLAGQIDYDWQTVGPLLRPYLGPQLQLAGRESRPFAIRGPLNAAVPAASKADALAWLKPLTIEAGSGWTSASFRGILLGATQFDARLADGKLSFVKPLQVGMSEGQLILAPHVQLTPGPAVVTFDKGPLVQKVHLSQAMCGQWMKYVAPMVADAARAEGQFSIDLVGGRMPLAAPATCDIAGKLTIVSADINPGPLIQPFALLGRQVKSVLSGQAPSLAAGNDRPLVHYPPQTVDFRVVNGRVYHDRIEMVIGDQTVRTHGSVGLVDESLILEAEVPLKTAPPLIGAKSTAPAQEQVVLIPIEGTLSKPKIDPRALENLAAQMLKNKTRNTIRNGINDIDNLIHPGGP